MSTTLAPHLERVLERIHERHLHPRPHDDDEDRWDAECPVCGGHLVVRDASWDQDSRRVMLFCDCDEYEILRALGLRERDLFGMLDDLRSFAAAGELVTVTLDEFVDVDEPGAGAILGDDDAALIPEGGDVMFYGDGGAGKTTLAIDLAFHLAAGDDWLGIPVARPVRVLLIENEGPRPMLRRKLRRKREAWAGGDLGDRLRVFDRPWGEVTLTTDEWREQLALTVAAYRVDVTVAGPVTRLGMDAAGTLQEVRAFMELVADLRRRCGRPIAVGLIHHENKNGSVSGAWEGSGDTLLHVQAAGNGHTVVHVQKARWSTVHSQQTLRLAWAAGEGFELEGDRDLPAEVEAFLTEHPLRTVKQISAARDAKEPGIGANEKAVRSVLEADPDRFDSCTGDAAKAFGRHPSAVLWRCDRASDSPDSQHEFFSRDGVGESVSSPLRGLTHPGAPLLAGSEVRQTPDSPAVDEAPSA